VTRASWPEHAGTFGAAEPVAAADLRLVFLLVLVRRWGRSSSARCVWGAKISVLPANRILITSASGANGDGYDAILAFTAEGALTGPFSQDRRISDPRGLSLDLSGQLVYVNSGDDRVLALDRHGNVVLDSGRIDGLDPGGGTFGPDGRYYLGLRQRRTILALPPRLDQRGVPLLPDGVVSFPRGFAFGHDGELYLASGVGPSGEGENTIAVFDRAGVLRTPRLVNDPELSPLDLTIAPNGNILVASEWPYGARDAKASIREYDPSTGRLARVFASDPALGFSRPRGLRFGPNGRIYNVGQDHVVTFDFSAGTYLGVVAHLPRLNGQALVLVL
jgi:DNA-binding beta-propeller fold protein YncE